MLNLKARKKIHPQIQASLSEQFSTEEMLALSKLGTIVTLPDNYTLTSEGESSREAIMVLNGTVDVQANNSTIAVVGRGEFIGAAGLKNPSLRTATAVSSGEISVLVFSPNEFDTLLFSTPSLASSITNAESHTNVVLDLTDRQPSPAAPSEEFAAAA